MNKMLVAYIVFLALAIPVSAANTVSIDDQVLTSGETKRVPIILNDATNIWGINITLSFNSSVVNVTSKPSDNGNFTYYAPLKVDNNNIRVTVAGAIGPAPEYPLLGLNGTQTIGYVNLTAVGCGVSALDLELETLITAAGVDINRSATVNSGSVTISGCSPTPVPTTPSITPTVTAIAKPTVTVTTQPNVTVTAKPNVTVTVTPPAETRRVVEIVDNISGVPLINQSTSDILAEDFINFNAGDRYNITVTSVTGGIVEYNASGVLVGGPKQTIKVNWIPKTQGAYILRSDANTTTEARIVQVINQKVISPIPELSTIALVSAGLLGLIGISRSRKK